MSATSTTELAEFHSFVGEQLQQNQSFTPEDVLELFRQQQNTLEELEQSVAAVKRALAQADRGEGIPLAEAVQRLREKHGLPDLADAE